MAKMKLEEGGSIGETEINESNKELFQKTCRTKELPVKSDFSDLHLFIPEGVEDWRLTVGNELKYFFLLIYRNMNFFLIFWRSYKKKNKTKQVFKICISGSNEIRAIFLSGTKSSG